MDIVHAASEVVGFAKTGGLADVVGSLPRALAQRGHRCAVFMPLYRCIRVGKIPILPTEHTFTIPIANRSVTGRLWRSELPESKVPVYLVENAHYYERDDAARGSSLYQYTGPNGDKRDYSDNCERYLFFSRAVLAGLPLVNFWPDVLHSHDWQTGLIPVLLNEVYRRHQTPGLAERFEKIRTVFTIHNIAYQGCFPPWAMPMTCLDWRLFNYHQLEFYNQLNFLKGGIVFSDWITTVSPTYAQEIQTPYYSWGMHGTLLTHRSRLSGIVNGADYRHWNPATDVHIAANYTENSVAQGKPPCKAALQQRLHLPVEPRTPLLGMVARLVEQKGLDLVCRSLDNLLRESGCQLAVLGEGDPHYQRQIQGLRDRFPNQVGIYLGFDEKLAHQIEAGADIYLMPSQYEPSGLNQLYSLKYGTVPVVRATGGLADTITDCTPQGLADGTATGFRFAAYSREAFLEAVWRALNLYHQHPDQWLQLMQNGMRQDWSWHRSAQEYEKVYAKICERP